MAIILSRWLSLYSLFFVLWNLNGLKGEAVTNIGTGCSVRDPVYGHVFDLTPLSNLSTPATLQQSTSQTFYFQPCKTLSAAQCGPGASICLQQDSGQIKLGSVSDNVIYSDSSITMRFINGDACPGTAKQYSSLILFVCSLTSSGAGQIILLHEDKVNCSYTFLWKTHTVCPPRTQVDCTVTDKSGQEPVLYDLNSLTLPEDNWEVLVPGSPGGTSAAGIRKILFNVCSSHIHSHDSRCNYEAAACLEEDFETRRFTDVGHALEGPFLGPNHTLTLIYANGSPCNSSGQYQLAKTVLTFQCEETATETLPVLRSFTDCDYNIHWLTAAACPLRKRVEVMQTDCRIEGFEGAVDLWPLADQDFEVKTNRTDSYQLHVCSPLKHSKCRPGSAVCHNLPTSSMSLGQATMKPMWVRNGEIQLMYSHGDACHGTLPATSRILFFCDPLAGQGKPVLGELSDDCQHIFHWKTRLTCALNTTLEEITNCQLQKSDVPLSLQTFPPIQVDVNKTSVDVEWCQFHSYEIVGGSALRVVKPGSCQSDNQTMEVYITCAEIQEKPMVLLNEACKLVVMWKTPSVCSIFNTSTGSAAVPILLVLMVASALILITILVLRKRLWLRKLTGPSFNNVRYTQIPINETIMDAEEREPLNSNSTTLHDQSDDELLT